MMQNADLFLADVDDYLARNGEPEVIEVLVPDMNGTLRGKWLPGHAMKKLVKGAVRLPISTYALDIWGHDVDEAGLALETGDPDGICYPVPGTLQPVLWRDRPTAQVIMSMYDKETGAPILYDPRHRLQAVVDQFKARGLTPVVATELEFYLFSPESAESGPPLLARLIGNEGAHPYDLEVMDMFGPLLLDIHDACEEQGIPSDTTIAEVGEGQYEINLLHVDNAVLAADQSLLLKRVIRQMARQHGLEATFMAKPHGDRPGNGMHSHISILDQDGNNIFSGKGEEINPNLLHAIGGLLESMPDFHAIFAPNRNSLRRFQPGSYAPTTPNWGIDHRGAAVRIPSIEGPDARLEHRVCGADVNPHLALTAILAGILDGLDNKMDPGLSLDKAPEAAHFRDNLTHDWHTAIDTFESSDKAKDAFGPEFIHAFTAIKREEASEFATTITDFEYRTYMRRL